MLFSLKFRLLILISVLSCTVGCDQISKHIARVELATAKTIALPGDFGEFRLADNPGSFLSFGNSLPASWRFTLLTVAVGIGLLGLFVYLARSPQTSSLSFIGLTLAWAGGTSNLIDRVTREGLVTDFIFLRAGRWHTGIFNIADVVIMVGIAFLACDLIRKNLRSTPSA